jgi:hypothetical protein
MKTIQLFFILQGLIQISVGQASQWAINIPANIVSINEDQFDNVFWAANFDTTITIEGKNYVSNGGNDILLGKINSEGRTIWVKQISSTGFDSVSSMAFHQSGSLWITGTYTGILQTDNQSITSLGAKDLMIIEIDAATGKTKKAVSGGGIGSDIGTHIFVNPNNEITLIGSSSASFQMGNTTILGKGGIDAIILRLNQQLQVIWSTSISGTGNETITAAYLNPNDNLFIGGSLDNSHNYCGITPIIVSPPTHYLLRLNSGGQLLWYHISDFIGEYKDIVQDHGMLIYVTGNISSAYTCNNGTFFTNTASEDIMLLKLGGNGQFFWIKKWGSIGRDSVSDISVTQSNQIILSGEYTNTIQFGSLALNAGTNRRSFFCILDTSGNASYVNSTAGIAQTGGGKLIETKQDYFYRTGKIYNSGMARIGFLDIPSRPGSFISKFRHKNGFTRGKLFLDEIGNGKFDSTEKRLANINVYSANNEGTYSNEKGEYLIPHPNGYNILVSGSVPFGNTVPSTTFTVNADGWNDTTRNLAYTLSKSAINQRIHLHGLGYAAPGGYMSYQIDYENNGAVPCLGYIAIALDSNLSIIRSSILPDSIGIDSIYWNLNQMPGISTTSFRILCKVDSSLAIGKSIITKAELRRIPGELNWLDNKDSHTALTDTIKRLNYLLAKDYFINSQEQYFNTSIYFENHDSIPVTGIYLKNTLTTEGHQLQNPKLVTPVYVSDITQLYNNDKQEFVTRLENTMIPTMEHDPMNGWGVISTGFNLFTNYWYQPYVYSEYILCADYKDCFPKVDTIPIQVYGKNQLDSKLNPFLIYPNPTTNKFHFLVLEGLENPISIKLINLQGITCKKIENIFGDNGTIEIEVDDLPKGNWILEVKDMKSVYHQIVLIE